MSEPFLSEIKIVSFNFPPKGWALCNGQLLPINQNQALFALLGTTYGGNGQTNFALPNIRGRVPIHIGNGHTLGEAAGSTSVTVGSPINAVLSALRATFVGVQPSAQEIANAMSEPIDPRIAAATDVKNRYDDALLKLPEVVGHGVGYSESGSGVAVIKLFMRKATREARQVAPTQIEGVPVEIEETGEVRVVPNCGSEPNLKK